MENEEKIWEGTSSQWSNFFFYICCAILTLGYGVGLILALWKYLDTKYNKIKITNQRIVEEKGILSKIKNQLELYRVKDIILRQPLILRIFGLYNIILITSDSSNEKYILKGIENGDDIIEKLRIAVEKRRDLKGVREMDFY